MRPLARRAVAPTTSWSTRPGGRRPGHRTSDSRPRTPSSRSPGPPVRGSPRRSTPSPAWSSPRSVSGAPPRRGPPACVWGRDGAGELLEWLGIPPRHQTTRDSMLDSGVAAPSPSWTGWCFDLPTTTRPSSPTTSRWTVSSPMAPTCSCGCSTRRSTPTRRSTTATSPGGRPPDVMLVVLNPSSTPSPMTGARRAGRRAPAPRMPTGSTGSRSWR